MFLTSPGAVLPAVTGIEVVCAETKPGEEVFVAGEWINWDVERAVRLWTTPETWPLWKGTLNTPFLTGTEYKYFIRLGADNNTNTPASIRWELLENRSLTNRFFSGARQLKDVFGQRYNPFSEEDRPISTASSCTTTTTTAHKFGESYAIPLEIIGKSQFRVFKAWYKGDFVAMKTIPLCSMTTAKQAQTEARLLELFSDSRYIVKGLRSYTTEDRTFVILEELLPKGSLFTALYKQKLDFNLVQRLRILMHVAEALYFIHSRGYIFRDLKSPNILLDDTFGAKLCDFGISKKEDPATALSLEAISSYEERSSSSSHSPESSSSGAGSGGSLTKGSPIWMAPEIAQRRSHDRSSDIYSFGVVMYEVMECALPKGRLYPDDIHSSSQNLLAPLIKACLNNNPAARPKARQLKMELRSMMIEVCSRRLFTTKPDSPPDYRSVLAVYNQEKNHSVLPVEPSLLPQSPRQPSPRQQQQQPPLLQQVSRASRSSSSSLLYGSSTPTHSSTSTPSSAQKR